VRGRRLLEVGREAYDVRLAGVRRAEAHGVRGDAARVEEHPREEAADERACIQSVLSVLKIP
jgi:hypothetical protein